MREYGVENSWMKLCFIDIMSGVTGGLRPVAYLKSRKQRLLEHCRGGLFWLDLEKDTVKEFAVEGHRYVSFSQFSPGSLLRLDDTDSVVVNKKECRDEEEDRWRFWKVENLEIEVLSERYK